MATFLAVTLAFFLVSSYPLGAGVGVAGKGVGAVCTGAGGGGGVEATGVGIFGVSGGLAGANGPTHMVLIR